MDTEETGLKQDVLLRVTPAGSAQYEAARRRALDVLGLLLGRLKPARLAALDRGLEPLVELLQERSPGGAGGEHVG